MSRPRIGSLCSGYGGLDMGVQAVYGGETVWVSDIDKGACKILAHRYPDVPNLGDFTQTDWSTVEPVDILTAGFPCQPVSGAGKGLGDQDERWLWDEVHRAIREVRPGVVVLENVRGLVSKFGGRLLARVLGSLADVGYDASWHGLKASDVGAPHGRWRIFIVAADSQRGGRDGWAREAGGREVGRAATHRHPQGPLLPTPVRADGERSSLTYARGNLTLNGALELLPTPGAYDAQRGGPQHPAKRRAGGHSVSLQDALHGLTLLPTPAVNDMGEGKTIEWWDDWTAVQKAKHNNGNGHGKSLAIELQRVAQGWGPYAAAVERWEQITGHPAPPPNEKASVREWMMGLPPGWITDVPDLTEKEKVKAAGNGVVPQQAAEALRIMADWQVAA